MEQLTNDPLERLVRDGLSELPAVGDSKPVTESAKHTHGVSKAKRRELGRMRSSRFRHCRIGQRPEPNRGLHSQ